MRFLLCIPALALLSSSSLAQVSEIDTLREPYRKSLAAVQAAKQERAAPVTRAYLDALARLEPQFAGNPPAAAVLREERARATEGRSLLEADRRKLPAAVAELRKRFDADFIRVAGPFLQQEQQLTRQYVSSLETLQRRFMAQNQVAKAGLVATERDAALTAAQAAGALSKPEGPAPADSTIGTASARAHGALDAGVAKKVRTAVAGKAHSRIENSSDKNLAKEGSADVPEEGGVLVGFEFFEVKRDGLPWIRSLRPYFLTEAGVVPGKDRGKMERVTDKVMARPGFGVAGLLATDAKAGVQVIFMKINPATGRFATDASNTYRSQWYGTKGREKVKQVGGDGRLVVGVYGRTGSDCDDLGFVVID
jgi:hypothetical protein